MHPRFPAGPRPLLLGMVHVGALPGTPFARAPLADLVATAVAEAQALRAAGFGGVLLENMHDRPYLKGHVGPEITAAMTVVAGAVRAALGPGYPLGLQILAGANAEAVAVAHAAGLDFVRAEGFAFGHLADEGLFDACAGPLLRYRRAIGAERVAIWADIQKKHSSHAISADLTLHDWAHGAEFLGADVLVVTGTATGEAAAVDDLRAVKAATRLPVAIGSGITPDNAADYATADAWIVGSSLKVDGAWANPLDAQRVRRLHAAWAALGRGPRATPGRRVRRR